MWAPMLTAALFCRSPNVAMTAESPIITKKSTSGLAPVHTCLKTSPRSSRLRAGNAAASPCHMRCSQNLGRPR